MGSLITLRRLPFPFFERRVVNWFGSLPLLYAFRPADFGSLIAGISYGVIGNRVEPALILGEGKNMIVNPIFQAEMKRPRLDCFGRERSFGFDKSRNTGVENFNQPIRYAVFHLQDRANPEVELLPFDVLIADFIEPLPRYPTGLLIGALAGGALKSGGRVAHGLPFGFLHTGVPGMGTQGCVSSIVVSEPAACRPILVDFADAGSNLSSPFPQGLTFGSCPTGASRSVISEAKTLVFKQSRTIVPQSFNVKRQLWG